jgi:hypothetical protein
MEENSVTEYNIDYIAESHLPRAIRQLRDFVGSETYFGADDKYVRWQYFDSPFKTTIVDTNRYSMLAFFDADKNILALDAFLPWKTYIGGKEVKTVWDIEWMNFSKIKGLGRELVKILRERTEIYCGYGLNQLSYNSYEKLGYPVRNEIERKVAIIDAGKCISVFGNEKKEGQFDFLRENEVAPSYKKMKYTEIDNIENISELYWLNHIERFQTTSCKNKSALKWRYSDHPYIKYKYIAIDDRAEKGLAVVRIEEIKGMKGKVLRILELFPVKGYEMEIALAVLRNAYEEGAILADFFCVSKKYCDLICPPPFLSLSEHREYDIPMLFQPLEIRKRKSINIVLDHNPSLRDISFEDFYATKGDGDQDQYVNEDYQTISL